MDEPLTPRERQVVLLVAEGLTRREIAAELSLSQGTVKNYLATARDRLGAVSTPHAVALLVRRENGTAR